MMKEYYVDIPHGICFIPQMKPDIQVPQLDPPCYDKESPLAIELSANRVSRAQRVHL